MDFSYELKKLNEEFSVIAGCDEAGRGPLAGPIVGAAVVFDKSITNRRRLCESINDSKKLTPKTRALLYEAITEHAKSWATSIIEVDEIDKQGIANANKKCILEAIKSLTFKPDFIVCDYIPGLHFDCRYDILKKGDAIVLSVAAASIIAKVTRDKIMEKYDKKFPLYGFLKHKGYGTRAHAIAIHKHGRCPIHRVTFTVPQIAS